MECREIIYNDICEQVVDLLQVFKTFDTEYIISQIEKLIRKFKLTKQNADGYLNLRKYYNEQNNNPIVFYTLLCYAFNYQIRFNKDGKYNMPFGKNRSSFNPVLKQKLIAFVENNLKYNNELLKDWISKYNVHYLNGNYANCNYHKIDRSPDIEVLITNY